MKKIYAVIGVIVVVGLGLFINDLRHPKVTEGVETIKVGIMLPLTSQYGGISEGIGKAAEMAKRDFEATHPDTRVELVTEDDKFEPKTGIAAFTKLTTLDKVGSIIMISTPVIDAFHKEMQDQGIPIVSIGLQNYGIEQDNIFQLSSDATKGIEYLAQEIERTSSHKKLAVIHQTNVPALVGFYTTFMKNYSKNTVEFVLDNADDARLIATKVQASEVDAIIFFTEPLTGGALTKSLLELEVTPSEVAFYYDAQLQTGWPEYEKLLGDMRKLDGSVALQFTTTDLTDFKARYMEQFGTDATPFAEYGYDGMKILLDTHEEDKVTWVNKIQSISYDGFSGNTRFDERGIRLQGVELWKVKDGKVVKL